MAARRRSGTAVRRLAPEYCYEWKGNRRPTIYKPTLALSAMNKHARLRRANMIHVGVDIINARPKGEACLCVSEAQPQG
jgi:hypothetical protein